MKKIFLILLIAVGLLLSPSLFAATTIDSNNHFAYGANLGWLDWRGDVANGAVVRSNVCSGYIWAANVGWINLGDGSPAAGTYYQNNSAGDFGVNLDNSGKLTGYAYGANIGWINFEATGAPKVDLDTGAFSGYAYSANCGWISLSNAFATLRTDASQLGGTSGPVMLPQINGLTHPANGQFTFSGVGLPNTTYTVQANTNLVTTNWLAIGTTTTGPLGDFQFTDLNAGIFSKRFYRLFHP
jgi:hypothetical protein